MPSKKYDISKLGKSEVVAEIVLSDESNELGANKFILKVRRYSWAGKAKGEMRIWKETEAYKGPTGAGVTFHLDVLPQIIDALKKLEVKQ